MTLEEFEIAIAPAKVVHGPGVRVAIQNFKIVDSRYYPAFREQYFILTEPLRPLAPHDLAVTRQESFENVRDLFDALSEIEFGTFLVYRNEDSTLTCEVMERLSAHRPRREMVAA